MNAIKNKIARDVKSKIEKFRDDAITEKEKKNHRLFEIEDFRKE